MHQEQFHQFEDATYHTSQTQHNQLPFLLEPSHQMPDINFTQDINPSEIIQPFSIPVSTLAPSITYDLQASLKNEYAWPQLDQISSAQPTTDTAILFDFSKINSPKEESNHEDHLELFNLNTKSQNLVQNYELGFTDQSTILANAQDSSKISTNLPFQFDLSPQNNHFYSLTSVGEQTTVNNEVKVEQFKWEYMPTNDSSNLYGGEALSTANQHLNIYQMNEHTSQNGKNLIQNIQENQNNHEDQSSIPNNQAALFQHHFQQSKQKSPSKPKQQNEQDILASFSGYDIPSIAQKTSSHSITQQFPVQVQPQAQQARKQSEQFVFQTQQADNTSQPIQIANKEQQIAVINEIINEDISPHKEKEQMQPIQHDDDEFGDFEETTTAVEVGSVTLPVAVDQTLPIAVDQTVNSVTKDIKKQEQPENEGKLEQNRLQINQNYLNSEQSEYYKNKQKELQQFINCLPDYSFLFSKAFLE